MTTKKILIGVLLTIFCLVALGAAQQAQEAAEPAQPSSPVAPQPQIKSQQELEAIQAIQNAPDPTSRIQACEDLAVKFPESEFKGFALQMATISAQMMDDYEKMMIYGDRTLEADPDNFVVMLAMANGLAQRTKKFDLDKEEKLSRATELATKALDIIDGAPRPNPQVTDEQWESAKNDFRAQAYEAMGIVELVREDYPEAVDAFKKAVDVGVMSNPATKVRLAAAYNQVGNPGEAIVTLDDVLAEADLHPQIRQIAQAERARAVKLQESKQ